MGSKQDPHRSYGQKIITLFVKLLFTRDEYSLGEPAGKIHRRVRRGRGGGISTPRRVYEKSAPVKAIKSHHTLRCVFEVGWWLPRS